MKYFHIEKYHLSYMKYLNFLPFHFSLHEVFSYRDNHLYYRSTVNSGNFIVTYMKHCHFEEFHICYKTYLKLLKTHFTLHEVFSNRAISFVLHEVLRFGTFHFSLHEVSSFRAISYVLHEVLQIVQISF